MAIIYPLRYCLWRGLHTTYIISVIWFLSFIIASPLLHYARAVPFNYSGLALYDCRKGWEGELSSSIYTVIIFTITFFIPFTSLTFLYGSIGIKTFKRVQPGETLTSMERVRNRKKIKVFYKYIVGSVLGSGISEKYVFEKNDFKVWDYNIKLWQQ
jgi:predicted membrane protein